MSEFDKLKAKHRDVRDAFEPGLNLRVHRALSWINSMEKQADQSDEKFILGWIALNAAYAEYSPDAAQIRDREGLNQYLAKIIELDEDRQVYQAIWGTFSGAIRSLLANPYIFSQYWDHQNGVAGYEDWEESFQRRGLRVGEALSRQDTGYILSEVFSRLYVLRNQLIHGGATWQGGVNRNQVRDGGRVLEQLVPVFVNIMMDNPEANWGEAYYPVQVE